MKVAVKLLSKTDLTLFADIFHGNETSKQKGLNLNSNVLIKAFYPSLPVNSINPGELSATLDLYGPNSWPLHREQRKIVKSPGAKNWRLNGKLIEARQGEEDRFSILAPLDVAIIGFYGDLRPTALQVILLSAAVKEDNGLREFLIARLGLVPSTRSMAVLALPLLEEALLRFPAIDSLRLLLPEDQRDLEIEEAALGGATSTSSLYERSSHGRSKPVSADELEQSLARVSAIGRAGEVLVNAYLMEQQRSGAIVGHVWASNEDALSPYDFSVSTANDQSVLADVKATSGAASRRFHMSIAELVVAANDPRPYHIYRVYEVDADEGAKMVISGSIESLAKTIIASLAGLPAGIRVNAVEIDPTLLTWTTEVHLPLIEDEVDED